MTWRDKLELGLKNDAGSRRDNLPPDEVHGPEEASGPGRSPVVTEDRDKASDNDSARRQRFFASRSDVREKEQASTMNDNPTNGAAESSHRGAGSEFDKDQPSENAGAPLHRGGKTDDGEPGRARDTGAIPPLDEPNVEGVGNENGD